MRRRRNADAASITSTAMTRDPNSTTIRFTAAVAMTILIAACGTSNSDATPQQSASVVSAAPSSSALGAELAGVNFEVRRDPG
jgi:hypothetical protein